MRATLLFVVLAAACALAESRPAQVSPGLQITAVDGIKVGHHTLKERPTGCTVVLALSLIHI